MLLKSIKLFYVYFFNHNKKNPKYFSNIKKTDKNKINKLLKNE